jgi:hypothetical protein
VYFRHTAMKQTIGGISTFVLFSMACTHITHVHFGTGICRSINKLVIQLGNMDKMGKYGQIIISTQSSIYTSKYNMTFTDRLFCIHILICFLCDKLTFRPDKMERWMQFARFMKMRNWINSEKSSDEKGGHLIYIIMDLVLDVSRLVLVHYFNNI